MKTIVILWGFVVATIFIVATVALTSLVDTSQAVDNCIWIAGVALALLSIFRGIAGAALISRAERF